MIGRRRGRMKAALVGSAVAATAVAVGPTASVHADPAPDCVDFDDQENWSDPIADDWFGDCQPLYGLGKVEFDVLAPDGLDFPVEFDLETAVPEFVGLDAAALNAYYLDDFGDFPFQFIPADLELSGPLTVGPGLDGGAAFRRHIGIFATTVSDVGALHVWDDSGPDPVPVVDPADVPAALWDSCGLDAPAEPFVGALYFQSFDPVSVTFTQIIDEVPWIVEVEVAPPTAYFLESETAGYCWTDLTVGHGSADWNVLFEYGRWAGPSIAPLADEEMWADIFTGEIGPFQAAIQAVTVTFDGAGGGPVPAPADIPFGSTATQPAAPARAGFTFGGWTLDGVPYDFAAAVTEDITLVAAWTPIATTTTTTTTTTPTTSTTTTTMAPITTVPIVTTTTPAAAPVTPAPVLPETGTRGDINVVTALLAGLAVLGGGSLLAVSRRRR